MARTSRQLSEAYRAVTEDIFKFSEAMGFKPTWQQRLGLQAVMDAHYGRDSNWIAIRSGQGPGKTALSGIVALWRTLWAEGAMTIVTAPTMRQCTKIWLPELRRQLKKADPWLKRIVSISKTKVEIAGQPDWGIEMVTATREENAQGFHEKNMTVIFEEASGIPREMVTQFKGTLSNPNALLLAIGNPNTRDSAFFDFFYGKGNGRWKHIVFNAEDTARDYPHILNPQRNRDLEDEFGRESDVYRVRVLGEFPQTDPNCVVSGDDVLKAFKANAYTCSMERRSSEHGGDLARQFGIDFARYGGDESVIFRRQGYALLEMAKFVRTDPSEAVTKAFEMQYRAGWSDRDCVFVADAGGMGQGLMHRFYNAHKQVVEFHNGGSSTKPREYANKVTEAWFHAARCLRAEKCYIVKDHVLMQQLSGRRYFTNKKGQLILETKDEYLRRGFESPDRADACVMALWDNVRATGHIHRVGERPEPEGNVARMSA